MLCIDIGSERSGVRTEDLAPAASELDLDETRFSFIEVQVRTDREGDQVFVQLEVSGTARLQCDRTLVDYDQALRGTYSVLFVSPEKFEELSDNESDVRVLEPGENKIDITEAVRDTLKLAIPIRRIAPGAEEKDIETTFGALEDDIDPRWAALKGIQQDSKSD